MSQHRKNKNKKSGKATQQLAAWQCIVCDVPCDDGEDDSIECFLCKNWAHKECCGLDEDIFLSLSNPKQQNLQWICKPCLDKSSEPQSRFDNMMDKLLDLIPLIHSLSSRLENIEKGLMGEKLEEKIEEVVDRKLAEIMEEQREVEKRKKNLIIVNLKESTQTEFEERKKEDLAAAKILLGKLVTLESDDLVEPVRLGKVGGNRPRMLRVTVKSEEKKKEIIRKAPELNKGVTINDKRIYVNSDYTQKQREKNKELRAEKQKRMNEGEENLVIRNGKIVSLKSKQSGRLRDDTGAGNDPKPAGSSSGTE